MKKPSKKFWKKLLYILTALLFFLLVIDYVVLPLYVSGTEKNVPDVVGKQRDEAIKILQDANFIPIIQTSRFDQTYKKNYVIFQKPTPNSVVKTGRRIYLTISGGEQQIKMPLLIGKTLRDATVTLERLGLSVGNIDSVESEFPINTIVEQQYLEGREIATGSIISIKVSVGPQVGMIRVPNLFGQTLSDAEKILKNNSLNVGNKIFIFSQNYLPNTVIDQYPSINTLAKIGDSVTVTLTRTK